MKMHGSSLFYCCQIVYVPCARLEEQSYNTPTVKEENVRGRLEKFESEKELVNFCRKLTCR